MPGSANARQCLGRKLEGLSHRNILIQTLKRNRATPIPIVLDDNMFDVKLRLRKLIRILHRISLRVTTDNRAGALLRARIVLRVARILRVNGNRRAKNHQRGGEPLQQ